MTEASDTLRRARRPGRADRKSARARHEPGRRIRAVRKADVSNEGTAWSAAWRLPEAGIVKGLASPLTRTPAAQLLKLPDAWRAEPAQSRSRSERHANHRRVEPAQSRSRSEHHSQTINTADSYAAPYSPYRDSAATPQTDAASSECYKPHSATYY